MKCFYHCPLESKTQGKTVFKNLPPVADSNADCLKSETLCLQSVSEKYAACDMLRCAANRKCVQKGDQHADSSKNQINLISSADSNILFERLRSNDFTAKRETEVKNQKSEPSFRPSSPALDSPVIDVEPLKTSKEEPSCFVGYTSSVGEKSIECNRSIIDLVGTKPMIQFYLDGQQFSGLWDTGSMVCLINKEKLFEKLPSTEIFNIGDVLDGMTRKIALKAANNSEISLVGVAMLKFSLPNSSNYATVPFLVTSQEIPQLIIGYNLIQYLVKEEGVSADILKSTFPTVKDTDALVNLISTEEVHYNVTVLESVVIPANTIMMVECKVAGKVVGESLLAFQPNLLLDADLSCPEFVCKDLKSLKIPVRNSSNFNVSLEKKSILGSFQPVSYVSELNVETMIEEMSEPNVCVVEAEGAGHDDNWLPPIDLTHLSDDQRHAVEKLLIRYNMCFGKDPYDIGAMKSLQMKINLHDKTPVQKPYRKIPVQLYAEVKEFLDTLLVNGWIQKSDSPYASPIVCVRKSCGGLRLCVDYRELNSKTIPDRMPIPRIHDVIENLGGMEWFSTLDLTKAYHQGFVSEESRKYTAFSTPWALYEWLRIPQGLTNAPPTFQRKINEVLEDYLHKFCSAYLDDVLAYSKTFLNHLTHLEKILSKIASEGMKLNPRKCNLFKNKVKYLGKIITSEGYYDDPANTEVVERLKSSPPKTVKDLRKLLGFVGYYRSSIPNFARIAKPLYELLTVPKEKNQKRSGQRMSNEKLTWTEDHQKTLLVLLEYLVSPAVMAYPDFELPFVVHCDASEMGLGAVLYQEQEKQLKVIAYASRSLSPAEKNYKLHSGKLEFLALKWSVCDKYRPYLLYSNFFTVYSDNNPLSYVLTTAKLNATGLRWIAELADFHFVVKYRPGKESSDCDFMSRHPNLDEFTETLVLDDVCAILNSEVEVVGINAINIESFAVLKPDYGDVEKIDPSQLKETQLKDETIKDVYEAVKKKEKPKVKTINSTSSLSTQHHHYRERSL